MSKEVKITCYGETRTYPNIHEAEKVYWSYVMRTEGAERDRYVNILAQLNEGMLVCSDEFDDY